MIRELFNVNAIASLMRMRDPQRPEGTTARS